jgi:aminodeoxyfutalosine deaminase
VNGSKAMLRAKWIAPMDRPILRDAAVVFADGRVIDLGDERSMAAAHPEAHATDLDDAILLPGLINAHTHLELSTCTVAAAPASFVEWILGIREQLKQTGLDEVPRAQIATRAGIEQCLRFGVTCVGDISQNSHASRPTIHASPLRCVSYGEALGLGGLRAQYQRLLARALDRSAESQRVRIGLSPHAPYTVDLDGYRECIDLARQHDLPLATHLAETPDERPFLEHHAGPFREMWDALGLWRDGVPTHRGPPIEFARDVGLLDQPALLAHVNYCDD